MNHRGRAAEMHRRNEENLRAQTRLQKGDKDHVSREQAAGARAIGFAASLMVNPDGQRGFDAELKAARLWTGFWNGAQDNAREICEQEGGLTLGMTAGGRLLHSAEYQKHHEDPEQDRGEGGLEERLGPAAVYLWMTGSTELAATAGEGTTISHLNGKPPSEQTAFANIEEPLLESRGFSAEVRTHEQRDPHLGTGLKQRGAVYDGKPEDLFVDGDQDRIVEKRFNDGVYSDQLEEQLLQAMKPKKGAESGEAAFSDYKEAQARLRLRAMARRQRGDANRSGWTIEERVQRAKARVQEKARVNTDIPLPDRD